MVVEPTGRSAGTTLTLDHESRPAQPDALATGTVTFRAIGSRCSLKPTRADQHALWSYPRDGSATEESPRNTLRSPLSRSGSRSRPNSAGVRNAVEATEPTMTAMLMRADRPMRRQEPTDSTKPRVRPRPADEPNRERVSEGRENPRRRTEARPDVARTETM